MIGYKKDYFEWQKSCGILGGTYDSLKFSKFINSNDTLIDFGCGGGFILDKMPCSEKIGIEINPVAREFCINKGLKVVESIHDIPDNWASVIISNHVLEHIPNPLDSLHELKKKIRNGGKIIFIVPNERNIHYNPNNIDQHLYTWAEVNLGNLFSYAGFKVLKVEIIHLRWGKKFLFLRKIFGDNGIKLFWNIYSRIRNDKKEIRIIAEKD
jgi:SAM-dependent methyltransferase